MRKHGKYCTEEQKYDFVKLKAFYPKLNQGRGLHSLLSNIGVIYYKTNTESKEKMWRLKRTIIRNRLIVSDLDG